MKKIIEDWKPTDYLLLGVVCLLMLGKRLALLNTQLNHEEAKEIVTILNILSGKLIYRGLEMCHLGVRVRIFLP